MAGIFARTTLRDGPQVAPANERLEKETGLAYHVSDTEHALLNAARVNVLRSVPGRGLRPMGARTRRKDGPFRQLAIRRLRPTTRRVGKEYVSTCQSTGGTCRSNTQKTTQ